MKHVTQLKMATFLVLAAAAFLPFQNCGGSMRFSAIEGSSKATDSSSEGNINLPDAREEETRDHDETPDHEDMEGDHESHYFTASCSSGAYERLDALPDLSKAEDVVLNDIQTQVMTVNQARQFSLVGFRGHQLQVKAAREVTTLENVKAHRASLRAGSVAHVDQIASNVVRIKSERVGDVSNLRANVARLTALETGSITGLRTRHFCASAAKFGSIHDVQSGFVKVIGRVDQPRAALASIEAVTADVMLLAHVKAGSVSRMNGRLIIRDAEIENLSDITGHVVVIDSRVKRMANINGVLILRNSVIESSDK